MSDLTEDRKRQIREEEEARFRARLQEEQAYREHVRRELEAQQAEEHEAAFREQVRRELESGGAQQAPPPRPQEPARAPGFDVGPSPSSAPSPRSTARKPRKSSRKTVGALMVVGAVASIAAAVVMGFKVPFLSPKTESEFTIEAGEGAGPSAPVAATNDLLDPADFEGLPGSVPKIDLAAKPPASSASSAPAKSAASASAEKPRESTGTTAKSSPPPKSRPSATSGSTAAPSGRSILGGQASLPLTSEWDVKTDSSRQFDAVWVDPGGHEWFLGCRFVDLRSGEGLEQFAARMMEDVDPDDYTVVESGYIEIGGVTGKYFVAETRNVANGFGIGAMAVVGGRGVTLAALGFGDPWGENRRIMQQWIEAVRFR
ncbi:MAG: hypothetical protein QY327_07320 [Fimbriimonadaceae bacterium]|nr:MAG: hypothetical protein QY327_07320 [Fimbriimonadaceae bacterium]